MNVSLTPKLEAFVKEKVGSGLYNNASEVVREALRLLYEREGDPGQVARETPKTAPRKDEVLIALRQLQGELKARGITSAALFGSILHGEATAESDIDVLVDVDPKAKFSLIDLITVKQLLEEKFSRPVDVVTREGLEPLLKETVFAEAEQAF